MLDLKLEVPSQTLPRIDTRVLPHVRVLNAILDEHPESPDGVVLLGRIDPGTFRFLRVDGDYQRPLGDRDDIFEALKNGTVPPVIDVGVRGQDFYWDENDCIIRSPAFIIDGWQRLGTAQRVLDLIPQLGIRLYAMCHFGTTADWEKRRFDNLNKNVSKVSSNLHLRNMRQNNAALLTLFGLCTNQRDFVLSKRVCWSQNMQRGELISSSTLAKTALVLHSRYAPIYTKIDDIAESINRAADAISLAVFRANVAAFFAAVNESWPFAAIEYRRSATQLKQTFLVELARVFSRHRDFWDASGKQLFVFAEDRRKLAKFAINDPFVMQLAGSGGQARQTLYRLIVDHINSGRRTHKLEAWS